MRATSRPIVYNPSLPYTKGITPTPPEWAGWTQKSNQVAKKLVADADYGPAKPLTFSLLYNISGSNKKRVIAAASIWKKNLGVDVKLVNQEWQTFLDSRHQGN